MQTNNHKIVDYDIILDKKFGKEGTPGSVLVRKRMRILSIQTNPS